MEGWERGFSYISRSNAENMKKVGLSLGGNL